MNHDSNPARSQHPDRSRHESRDVGERGTAQRGRAARDTGANMDLGPGPRVTIPRRTRTPSLRSVRDQIRGDLDRARVKSYTAQRSGAPEPTLTAAAAADETANWLSLEDAAFAHALRQSSEALTRADRAVAQAEALRVDAIARLARMLRAAQMRATSHRSDEDDGLPAQSLSNPSTADEDLFHNAVAAEIATAVRESQTRSNELVTSAVFLIEALPETYAKFHRGDIGSRHVSVILEHTKGAEEGQRQVLDAALAREAERMTPSRLRSLGRSLREQVDPIDAERKAQFARADRDISYQQAPWGMAQLILTGPAPDILCAKDRVQRIAARLRRNERADYREQLRDIRQKHPRHRGESNRDYRERLRCDEALLRQPRTLSQLRFDAGIALLMEGETAPAPRVPAGAAPESNGETRLAPERAPTLTHTEIPGGIRGEVRVTMPLDVVLGLQQHASEAGGGVPLITGRPQDNQHGDCDSPGSDGNTLSPETILGERYAQLSGYGPIDAETAREVSARIGAFARIITDPNTGAALHLGRTEYVPSEELRRVLRVRDQTCRFPGCDRPASTSDLDHSRAWSKGGETTPGNLAHLCRKHHDLKGDFPFPGRPGGNGWVLRDNRDGVLIWESPTGRRYATDPVRLLPASGPPPKCAPF